MAGKEHQIDLWFVEREEKWYLSSERWQQAY
jgi:hypothetical protein